MRRNGGWFAGWISRGVPAGGAEIWKGAWAGRQAGRSLCIDFGRRRSGDRAVDGEDARGRFANENERGGIPGDVAEGFVAQAFRPEGFRCGSVVGNGMESLIPEGVSYR